MQPLIPDAGFFPTLVFDPDVASAREIAEQLTRQGCSVRVAQSAPQALRAVKETYFRVVFVVSDLTNEHCLRFLVAVHRAAPRTWIIVASAVVNRTFKKLVYRHGGDALMKSPVDVPQLAERISHLQARSRPFY